MPQFSYSILSAHRPLLPPHFPRPVNEHKLSCSDWYKHKAATNLCRDKKKVGTRENYGVVLIREGLGKEQQEYL